MVQMLQGIVPDNELLAQVPFVDELPFKQMDEAKRKGYESTGASVW